MELVYSSCGLNYIWTWGGKWLAMNLEKCSLMTDSENLCTGELRIYSLCNVESFKK